MVVIIIIIKVKWSRYWPGVAQRVGRGIALLFHDRGTRRGWVVSSTPRPHFTLGKDPVPILQEAAWAPGPVWRGAKSRPHRDSIPDRPARSQSLYWLSYPILIIIIIIVEHNNNILEGFITVFTRIANNNNNNMRRNKYKNLQMNRVYIDERLVLSKWVFSLTLFFSYLHDSWMNWCEYTFHSNDGGFVWRSKVSRRCRFYPKELY